MLEYWLMLRAALQRVVQLCHWGLPRPYLKTLKHLSEVEGLFLRALGCFITTSSIWILNLCRQITDCTIKGALQFLIPCARGCPQMVEVPSKCNQQRWRHTTNASQVQTEGSCTDPSLGLCFGESLLTTEAGEMLILVPLQKCLGKVWFF